MNKKGFTLVELLGVITILAIVVTISFSSYMAIKNNSLENILKTKIEQIEHSAIIYGQENPNEINNTNCDEIVTTNKEGEETRFKPEYCKDITVEVLIEGSFIESKYLDDGSGEYDLINDVTGKSMKQDIVTIYRKNNQIYSIMKDIKSNN